MYNAYNRWVEEKLLLRNQVVAEIDVSDIKRIFLHTVCVQLALHRRSINVLLAGHPLRGWPARLRGHKGSGLWKVWTVPSPPPLPSPPLPSPPLPPSLPLACHVAETAISRICRSG